jgi:hypothetical protein
MEDVEMQNAPLQGPPNMIGLVANLKVGLAKRKAKVRKMPSLDRNFASLTPEELGESGF